MNTVVTSKEEILAQCRALVMEKGLSAINMRTVASACGVAVGSIYNYFPSKADLIYAAVEDVWKDIFHMSGSCFSFTHFTDCLRWLFESIRRGCEKYPGFFTLHSVSAAGDKSVGLELMERYTGHIRQNLVQVLINDPDIRPDAFNEILTPEVFIEMIFTLVTSMLLNNQWDCRPLLEMAAHSIY